MRVLVSQHHSQTHQGQNSILASMNSVNQSTAKAQPYETTAPKKLRLYSPVGAEPLEYEWPFPTSKNNVLQEMLETIRFVGLEFPDLKHALEQNVLNNFDPRSYETMKMACDKYNKVIAPLVQMNKGTTVIPDKRPSTNLLYHIIQICYNHGVGDIDKLNKHYTPFSPEVYGETSFKFIQQMVEEVGFTEDDNFIDLGSGVGQVVLQVAAATNCSRCIGIEKADIPAGYSQKMLDKFKQLMNWYGKKYSDIELIHDDFFKDEYKEAILGSTFIFCNNFAFGPAVDHQLKTIFEGLKDGTRILSSKAFCPLNFRLSPRTQNEIGAMMKNVVEIHPHPDHQQSVSWTGKAVSYFLHTIDRTTLELYYFEKNKRKEHHHHKGKHHHKGHKDPASRGKNIEDSNSSSSISLNSINTSSSTSDSSSENQSIKSEAEELIPQKWTRRAWSEFHNTGNGTPQDSKNIAEKGKKAPGSKGSGDMTVKKADNKENERKRPRPSGKEKAAIEALNAEVEAQKERERLENEAKKMKMAMEESDNDDDDNENDREDQDRDIDDEASGLTPRRGRPRKVNNNPANPNEKKKTQKKPRQVNAADLELLHERTIQSTSEHFLGKGCVDQKLVAKSSCQGDGYPNLIMTNNPFGLDEILANSPTNFMSPANSSMHTSALKTPKIDYKPYKARNLDELMQGFRHMMLRFQDRLRCPQFREDINKRIEAEKKRREQNIAQINELNKEIYESRFNSQKNLEKILAKRNIENYTQFVAKMNDLHRRNQELKDRVQQARQAINISESENENLLNLVANKAEERKMSVVQKEKMFHEKETELKKILEVKLLLEKDRDSLRESLKSQMEQNSILEKTSQQQSSQQQATISSLEKQLKNSQTQLAQQAANFQQQLQHQQQQLSASSMSMSLSSSSSVKQETAGLHQATDGSSPKPNYKEMKYKKYLSRHVYNTDASNPSLLEDTNSNSQFNANNDDAARSVDSELFQEANSGKNAGDSQRENIQIDMVDRIHQMISLGLNDKNAQSAPNQSLISEQNILESTSPSKNRRSSRNKASKPIETIKSSKKDRQILITNSGPGGPKTQLVRQPSTSSASLIQDSTSNKIERDTPKPPEEKPFSFKLKINCKDKKVVDLSNPLPAVEESVPERESLHHSEYQSSRKRKESSNSLEIESGGGKKKKSKSKDRSKKEEKRANSQLSEETQELKNPSLVLKKCSNGQYYQLKNDDNSQDKRLSRSNSQELLVEPNFPSRSSNNYYQPEVQQQHSQAPFSQQLHSSSQNAHSQQQQHTQQQQPQHQNTSQMPPQTHYPNYEPSPSFGSSRSSSIDSPAHSQSSKKSKKEKKEKKSKAGKNNGNTVDALPQVPGTNLAGNGSGNLPGNSNLTNNSNSNNNANNHSAGSYNPYGNLYSNPSSAAPSSATPSSATSGQESGYLSGNSHNSQQQQQQQPPEVGNQRHDRHSQQQPEVTSQRHQQQQQQQQQHSTSSSSSAQPNLSQQQTQSFGAGNNFLNNYSQALNFMNQNMFNNAGGFNFFQQFNKAQQQSQHSQHQTAHQQSSQHHSQHQNSTGQQNSGLPPAAHQQPRKVKDVQKAQQYMQSYDSQMKQHFSNTYQQYQQQMSSCMMSDGKTNLGNLSSSVSGGSTASGYANAAAAAAADMVDRFAACRYGGTVGGFNSGVPSSAAAVAVAAATQHGPTAMNMTADKGKLSGMHDANSNNAHLNNGYGYNLNTIF